MNALAFSAPAERNKHPILEVLRTVLPMQGSALEIASGTGQHVAWFAQHLSAWQWQPTDWQAEHFSSIAARVAQGQLKNVQPPQLLDVCAESWLGASKPAPVFDLVYCANMLHISPWATCAGLMRGAARHVARQGVLVTYGPYLEEEVPTSPGNLSFDQSLRAQDPSWGLRRREDVELEAGRAGLQLAQRHAMPTNNLLLVWARAP